MPPAFSEMRKTGTSPSLNVLTSRMRSSLGEPETFEAYRQKWGAAAAVVVPLVRQAQTAGGIEPCAPERYEGHP